MAAVFARTLNLFANTEVLDGDAPQALPKYQNCTRKETNEKYLHKSNKNYKIKYISFEYKLKSTITCSVRQ